MGASPALHPAAGVLKAFASGRLDDAAAETVMSHLDSCPDCCRAVAASSGDDFLARLRQARSRSGTPAPAQTLSQAGRPAPPAASQTALPNLPPQLASDSQYEVLRELGAADQPRVVAVNKVDLLGPASRRRVVADIGKRNSRVVPISATTGSGLEELLRVLEGVADEDMVRLRLLVPYGREQVLHELRQLGGLERSEFTEGGTLAWGRAPRASLHRFQPFLLEGA